MAAGKEWISLNIIIISFIMLQNMANAVWIRFLPIQEPYAWLESFIEHG